MIDVIISEKDFDGGRISANNELSDILKRIVSFNINPKDRSLLRESLDTFLGSYYALSSKIAEGSLLSRETNRREAIWYYSIGCASSAALNCLEDLIGSELAIDSSSYRSSSSISMNDFEGKSQYSVASQSLAFLKRHIDSRGSNNMTVRLSLYFATLEDVSLKRAKCELSPKGFEELKQINPVSEKVDFTPKSRVSGNKKTKTQNGDAKVESLEGDRLPDSLPEFTSSEVRLDEVFGNDNEIEVLEEFILRALHYDPKAKKNYFWMGGNGFPEGMLLYGNPGSGKTMMSEAFLNYAAGLSQRYGIDFMPVELSGKQIASVYQNRSAVVLGHYFSMLRQGDKSHIVLLDEFDDLIPMGRDGMGSDAKQRLSEFKRCTGNSRALGNYFMIAIANNISGEKDIPPAVKDRFVPMYVPGPQTAEDYGSLLRNSLPKTDPSIDWSSVGGYLIEWKENIERGSGSRIGGNDTPEERFTIGRSYKMITNRLAFKLPKPIKHYCPETLGKSAEFHSQFYSPLIIPVTQNMIYDAIDSAMKELMQSRAYGAGAGAGSGVRSTVRGPVFIEK